MKTHRKRVRITKRLVAVSQNCVVFLTIIIIVITWRIHLSIKFCWSLAVVVVEGKSLARNYHLWHDARISNVWATWMCSYVEHRLYVEIKRKHIGLLLVFSRSRHSSSRVLFAVYIDVICVSFASFLLSRLSTFLVGFSLRYLFIYKNTAVYPESNSLSFPCIHPQNLTEYSFHPLLPSLNMCVRSVWKFVQMLFSTSRT